MGLQTKPFNVKQLTNAAFYHQQNQHVLLQNPQTETDVQMTRQLAERLQEMQNLMQELVETLQRANQQLNRSLREIEIINAQNNHQLARFFRLQINYLQQAVQGRVPDNRQIAESQQAYNQSQQQQESDPHRSPKTNTALMFLLKLGLQISVPIAAFYFFRNFSGGRLQSALKNTKRVIMNWFLFPRYTF